VYRTSLRRKIAWFGALTDWEGVSRAARQRREATSFVNFTVIEIAEADELVPNYGEADVR